MALTVEDSPHGVLATIGAWRVADRRPTLTSKRIVGQATGRAPRRFDHRCERCRRP